MNTLRSSVVLKKLQRIANVSRHCYNLIIDISNGQTEIQPVYKIPDKLTVIDVYNELISILIKLNINFVVENNAPRKGRIGIKIVIKTHVTNGNNRAKV